MIAKRQRRLHANVLHTIFLLFVLIASLEISEGLPLSPTLFYNDLLYHKATSGNEGPAVYRANEHHGLLDRHNLGLDDLPFQSEVYSTENGNVPRRWIGQRKLQGSTRFTNGRPEFGAREQINRNQPGRPSYVYSKTSYPFRETDAGFALYSAAVDGSTGRHRKSYRLDQSDRMLDDLLAHLSNDDESAWNDDGGLKTGLKRKTASFRLRSSFSKRDKTATNRSEGAVHPVFLGYGQETTSFALSTLARLLADRQLNPSEGRTRESIRFIG